MSDTNFDQIENRLKELNRSLKADEIALLDLRDDQIVGSYRSDSVKQNRINEFIEVMKVGDLMGHVKGVLKKVTDAKIDFKFPWGYIYVKEIDSDYSLLMSFPPTRDNIGKINASLSLFSIN